MKYDVDVVEGKLRQKMSHAKQEYIRNYRVVCTISMNKRKTPSDTIFFIFYYTPIDISYGSLAGNQSNCNQGMKPTIPKIGTGKKRGRFQ